MLVFLVNKQDLQRGVSLAPKGLPGLAYTQEREIKTGLTCSATTDHKWVLQDGLPITHGLGKSCHQRYNWGHNSKPTIKCIYHIIKCVCYILKRVHRSENGTSVSLKPKGFMEIHRLFVTFSLGRLSELQGGLSVN